MGKPIVSIKIPTLSGVNAGILVFVNTLRSMENLPFEFRLDLVLGYKPHDYARNYAIRDVFENEDIKKVWFIDSDVVPTPKCIKLLTSGYDITTACVPYLRRVDGLLTTINSAYLASADGNWQSIDASGDRIMEIDAAGTAMMVIDRKVLTDPNMWLSNDHSAYIGKKPTLKHILFRHTYEPDGSMATGEDLDFCKRATAHGYRIACDTSVRVGHLKELDMEEFRKSLAAIPVMA
jgi:hypothetical protein